MGGSHEVFYDVALAELVWGGLLVAITIAAHAVGMAATLQLADVLKKWATRLSTRAPLIAPVILGAWLVCAVHLLEVGFWASFLVWKGIFPNGGVAYAYALMTYTTLGSQFVVPLDWRVFQGLLAMTGLMTFAWSTAVLATVARVFQGNRHHQKA